ncbi:MAG: hypothetical protein JSU63_04015 [Phycisphaerales bacterium]|nr:MAG: hypothetical protein JSU63_04015 [Phycisphaerales bacterium]
MQTISIISLASIGIAWSWALRTGYRWALACGVRERVDALALGCVLPTAGLVFSVHVTGIFALLSGAPAVTPPGIAAILLLVTWLSNKVILAQMPPEDTSSNRELLSPRVELGIWWVPVLVVMGMYAVFLVDALTRYPTGFDALSYHLPLAVQWTQNGSMDLTFLGVFHMSFPGNGSIIPMLLVFAKLERLLPVVHFPNAILLGLVAYGLARAIRVSPRGAVVASVMALTVPMVVFQSFSGYIDLYAAVFSLVSLLALVWTSRATDPLQVRWLIAMAGLSAGVALGAKLTYLVLVVLLALVVLSLNRLRNRSVQIRYRPLRAVALFAAAALVCSGFWFVRNTVQAGNPFYPLAVKVGGHELLPGIDLGALLCDRPLTSRITRSLSYPWSEPKAPGYNYGVNSGFGAAYAAFVPVGLFWSLGLVLFRRPRDELDKWRIVYLLIVLSGIVLLVTAFWAIVRYALPFVVLSIPLATVMMDRMIARFRRASLILVTASLLVTVSIATLRPAKFFLGRARDHHWDRASFYEVPRLIDRLPPGTRILNVASVSTTYPLLGRFLSNKVVTVEDELPSAEFLRAQAIEYIYTRKPWPDTLLDGLDVQLIYDDTDTRLLKTTPPTRVYRVTSQGRSTGAADPPAT